MANETQETKTAEVPTKKPLAGTHKSNVKSGNHRPGSSRKDSERGTENPDSLKMLFEMELKEIYSIEKQLIKALPEMAKAVGNIDLKSAFKHHLVQTEKQKERLEDIFRWLKMDLPEKNSKSMEKLIEEGIKELKSFEEGPVRDAAAIIASQKIEHYEICAYGSLYELADVLGFHRIARLLDRSLDEEANTDRHLSELGKYFHDMACDSYEMQMNY